MNKRQNNKLKSYNDITAVLSANQSVYEVYPVIKMAVENLFSIITQIKTLATQSAIDNTGITEQKTVIKEKLSSLAVELAASASAYAVDLNDKEMEAALDFSYSDIRYARDNDTISITSAIYNELAEHNGKLTDYLVTDDDKSALKRLIDDFEEVSKNKGLQHSQSVSDTKKLCLLFKEADGVLTQKLDRLLMRLRRKAPSFYNAYLTARNIIDL